MLSGTGASVEKPAASCSTNFRTLEGNIDREQAAMVVRNKDTVCTVLMAFGRGVKKIRRENLILAKVTCFLRHWWELFFEEGAAEALPAKKWSAASNHSLTYVRCMPCTGSVFETLH